MSFTALMNKQADLYRPTETRTSMGAVSTDWGFAIAVGVPVRLQPISGRERAMFGQMGVDVSHKLYCGFEIEIREKDEFQIGERRFQILWVGSDSSEHHQQIAVQELKYGGA